MKNTTKSTETGCLAQGLIMSGLKVEADIEQDEVSPDGPVLKLFEALEDFRSRPGGVVVNILGSIHDAALSAAEAYEEEPDLTVASLRIRTFCARLAEAIDTLK